MSILDLRQLRIFSKALAHDFCIKFEILTFDSFGKISLEIPLSHPLDTKPAFLYFKFSISDSRQIWIFSKGWLLIFI